MPRAPMAMPGNRVSRQPFVNVGLLTEEDRLDTAGACGTASLRRSADRRAVAAILPSHSRLPGGDIRREINRVRVRRIEASLLELNDLVLHLLTCQGSVRLCKRNDRCSENESEGNSLDVRFHDLPPPEIVLYGATN